MKKCLFDNASGCSSVGPHFLEEMGFIDYLGIGLKWSLLNRRPFHPSLVPGMDPFCGWGFLGFPLRAKVLRIDLGPLPHMHLLA